MLSTRLFDGRVPDIEARAIEGLRGDIASCQEGSGRSERRLQGRTPSRARTIV